MKNRDEDYDDDSKKTARKTKNKKSGIALAIWILIALVIFVIFLVEQDKILSNLKSTDFFKRVFGNTPSFVETHESVAEPEIEKNDVQPVDINVLNGDKSSDGKTGVVDQNEAASTQKSQPKEEKPTKPSTEPAATSTVTDKTESKTESQKAQTAKPTPAPLPTPTAQKMNVRLFFMEIGSDGSVNRKEIIRTMKKSNSPLVDTINALIAGPTGEEADKGCRSLIPSGSKLLNATIKNGVATLNFNEDFEFNQYGVEGTLGQLQEIVYTATAFQTVESVQFLVDGELKDYLGSEGVWIGSPLNRNSFK